MVLTLSKILTHKDFDVIGCVTHHYEKDGMWFWHCMTCNTGSGKRHKHINGHRLEGDAAIATKYHRNAKRLERQQELFRAWWWEQIMTTADVEFFVALWEDHWGVKIWDEDPSDIMASVQSDNHLWEYMKKLNGYGRREGRAKAEGSQITT